MEQMKTDIALIKKRIGLIIDEMKDVKTALDASDPITKTDFDSHAIQDRWAFGLIVALLICVIGKLIHG